MTSSRRFLVLALLVLAARSAGAQTVSGLVWRNVGPFRAGRVSAVSGAIGEAGVFYAGFPAAGLWKTTNAGATWDPVFDAITSVSSIGAVEVAPSDTSVIYVGTGDKPAGGNIDEGDGVYKSTDAGRTWRHIGLDSTKQSSVGQPGRTSWPSMVRWSGNSTFRTWQTGCRPRRPSPHSRPAARTCKRR